MNVPKLVHILIMKEKDPVDDILLPKWKPFNKSWEFLFWKESSLKNKLSKYPEMLILYNYFQAFPEYTHICEILAVYVLMKEYGGLYMHFSQKQPFSFDDILNNNNIHNTIYIDMVERHLFFFKYKEYLLTEWLAMEKDHPIWESAVFPFLVRKERELALALKSTPALVVPIPFARSTCAKSIEVALVNMLQTYPIVEIQNMSISRRGVENSLFRTRLQQFGLMVAVVVIILTVEKVYLYNVKTFGAINVLPGIGVISANEKKRKK